MDLDPLWLSRIQFAITVGFHFLFPPLSIGLAWMLVYLEKRGQHDADIARACRVLAKILGLTFAMGVATGITMEFQFGTNWSRYATFVGDVFGAPLAAEGVFAFFLESTFIGVYLFARKRVSPRFHWFSILITAIGATLSAFWIIVANSWQQTPAGYEVVLRDGTVLPETAEEAIAAAQAAGTIAKVQLTDFFSALFNASTLPRFTHTMAGCLLCGSFGVLGLGAYYLLKNREDALGRKCLGVGAVASLVFAIACLFPTGHHSAVQVTRTQPAKLATIEGVIAGQEGANFLVAGIPSTDAAGEPQVLLPIDLPIPGLLSFLATGHFSGPESYVPGIKDFPHDERPPFFLPFISFHAMVGLGNFFIGFSALVVFLLWRRKLTRWPLLLKLAVLSVPLPVICMQLGWIVAEVGRQPWVVYRLLRTADAFSPNVKGGEVLASIILFSGVYALMLALFLFVLFRTVKRGPPTIEELEQEQGGY